MIYNIYIHTQFFLLSFQTTLIDATATFTPFQTGQTYGDAYNFPLLLSSNIYIRNMYIYIYIYLCIYIFMHIYIYIELRQFGCLKFHRFGSKLVPLQHMYDPRSQLHASFGRVFYFNYHCWQANIYLLTKKSASQLL